MDSNATASANGWLFQIASGIFLFFDDIKNNVSLKIEGDKEDVEIKNLKKNKYIQVKCLENVNARSSVFNHYDKALKSLHEADDGKSSLIYFSNIKNPFISSEASFYDYGCNLKYADLTQDVQDKIRTKLGEDFNYKNLFIQVVYFYGAESSKKDFVLNRIKEFLAKLNCSESKANQVYDKLITEGFHNAVSHKIVMKKEEFILNVILPYLNDDISLDLFEKIMDSEHYYNCINEYEKYLYSKEVKYSLFTKISTDFAKYKQNTNGNCYEYIKDNFLSFLYLVPDLLDNFTKEGIIKMLLYKIISKKTLLSKAKMEAGL